MGRPKGTPKTGGRVKGQTSNLPTIREMIVQALHGYKYGGGVGYLEWLMLCHPQSFTSLMKATLPPQPAVVNVTATLQGRSLLEELVCSAHEARTGIRTDPGGGTLQLPAQLDLSADGDKLN